MRVAVLATSRHRLRQPWTGGQEAVTGLLCSGLRRRGHEVVLHARAGSDASLADELVPYPDLPPLSAVSALDPHLPEPEFLRDHAAFTHAVASVLRDGRIDLVHNQSLHHLPLSMSAVLPPVVTTLHTPPFPWMEMGVALADERVRYVCVSEASARDWTCLPAPPTIIPNGVPADGPVGRGGPDLVWVGRITPEKGVDLAIAAARAAGRRLVLAGPVGEEVYYQQRVRPLLGADVEHAGHLDSAGLVELVGRSAVCLVTPRWEEPFGMVAAEAMVRGTPVAGIARGGLTEVVRPEGGVLVPDGDEDELVRRLADAIGAAEQRDRDEVARWSRSSWAVETMVERYERLFEEVLSAEGARAEGPP